MSWRVGYKIRKVNGRVMLPPLNDRVPLCNFLNSLKLLPYHNKNGEERQYQCPQLWRNSNEGLRQGLLKQSRCWLFLQRWNEILMQFNFQFSLTWEWWTVFSTVFWSFAFFFSFEKCSIHLAHLLIGWVFFFLMFNFLSYLCILHSV